MIKKRKVIRVGVDLDGVVAKHPAGGFWVWARKLKEKVLKNTCVSSYYYPTGCVEKTIWKFINKQKKPFCGYDKLLCNNKKIDNIKLFLVTGRFKFIEELTKKWLAKYKLDSLFEKILINTSDIDPKVFKKRMIEKYNLDYYIEDDLEVVNFLRKKTKAKLFWVIPNYRNKNENKFEDVKSFRNLSGAFETLRKVVSD
jgi:uncharacterized HAD superfamily protein